jgi:hypothetical protein
MEIARPESIKDGDTLPNLSKSCHTLDNNLKMRITQSLDQTSLNAFIVHDSMSEHTQRPCCGRSNFVIGIVEGVQESITDI